MKRVLSFLANEWILVLLLVVIGAVLRFANFSTTMTWNNDVSRDMLVSWQIATLDHWPSKGHFNTGISGFYQPYYFYFLGFLAKIGGTPGFIYFCFIALHSVSLVGIYLFAKNLFDKQAGFVALVLSVFAASLINLAHFPTAAPWSWPLYILSLVLTSFWQTTKNRNYLWLAAAMSFIAAQVHGSQLLFLALLLFLIRREKLSSSEYLAWFGTLVCVLVNQQAFIKILFTFFNSSVTHFDWHTFWSFFRLFSEITFVDERFFYLFCGVFSAALMWLIWQKKPIFQTLNQDWKLYAGYIVLFELAVALQKTGALSHHQYYVIPVFLVLVSGWIVHLKIPVAQPVGLICKSILLGLFAGSVAIHSLEKVRQHGEFEQTRKLYAALKQHGFPLNTATVLVTDNNPNKLGEASNSTEIWWFLATDLGRNDFNSIAWSLGNYARQLIVVCNTKISAENEVNCMEQNAAILTKGQRRFVLISTTTLNEAFQINVYEE